MIKKLILLPLLMLITFTADAQKVQLTNALKFESGIYLSVESFQKNQPDYTWEELITSAYVNEERYVAHIEFIKKKVLVNGEYESIMLDEVWGFAINGMPYIRIYNESKDLKHFAGLRSRGKLCYFTYEGYKIEKVPMTVYDPATQKAIHTQYIENRKEVIIEKVLLFENGDIADFSVENLKKWITDDEKLKSTIDDLTVSEAKNKLYKAMLIYNDRNPVFILEN